MEPWKYFYPPENRNSRLTGVERFKLKWLYTVSFLQNRFLSFVTRLIYRKAADPERILIFRTGSIGDSVCAIPAIVAIGNYYPKAQIDILTNAGAASLVGLGAFLPKGKFNECIDYREQKGFKLFRFLKRRKYDMVIQLPQVDAGFFRLLRDLFLFRWVSRSGWGWQKGQVNRFRKTQARFLLFPGEVKRLLDLIRRNGISSEAPKEFIIPQPADVEFVKNWARQNGAREGKPIIAVVVGAKRPQNRWPLSHFEQVIKYFEDSYTVIAVGGPEDAESIEQIKGNCKILNACGAFSPMQSAAILGSAVLTISNDTGPMHLSYASGTPTLAIFSSRDLPGKWYPNGEGHFVFRSQIHCQACFSDTCADNICMKAISAEEVIAQARRMLEKDKSGDDR